MSDDIVIHREFLELALKQTSKSLDPSTQVGAVIVSSNERGSYLKAVGHNQFPRGVTPTETLLNSREEKLRLIVHAEMAAITSAAMRGAFLAGSTLYIVATDASGAVWGCAPCCRCAVHVIQAGISKVVTHPFKEGWSHWADDVKRSRVLLERAGVEYLEIPYEAAGTRRAA